LASGRTLGHADGDCDPMLAQPCRSSAIHQRVRIDGGRNDVANAGRGNALDARTRTTGMAAGFERAVESRATGPLAGAIERANFGMRQAGALVITVTDNDAVIIDNHGADHGIGCSLAASALRQAQGTVHERQIRAHHFSSNSASTYSAAENGTRSSMPSPTPT
jgi:hypothetical protein